MNDSTGEVAGAKWKRSDAPQLPEDILHSITLRKRKQDERESVAIEQEPEVSFDQCKSKKRKTKARPKPKVTKKRVVHVKVLTSENRIQALNSVKIFKEKTRESTRRTHTMLFNATH